MQVHPAFFDNIPAELKARPQWVVWRMEDRLGKLTKVPYSARYGGRASSTNANTWTTFDDAVAYFVAHRSRFNGIGFVVTDNDPYIGVDLDHCIDPDTQEIAPWALEVLWALHSYTEVTPSGTGLRVFVRGSLPAGGRKRGNFEVYSTGRFLTLTGWIVRCNGGITMEGDTLILAPTGCITNNCGPDALPIIEERTAELAAVHLAHFGPPEEPQPAPAPYRGPVTADDQALIQRAMDAANGHKMRTLWYGLPSGHASDSEADEALVSHLCFWTGGDPQRIDALFRQSARFRGKWDEIHSGDKRTYGQMTIMKVLRTTTAAAPDAGRRRPGGGIPL